MNNKPRARLGNKAPITVFTGLPRQSSLGCIKASKNHEMILIDADRVAARQAEMVSTLSSTLDEMHKLAQEKSTKERERKVNAFNNKTGTRPVNFSDGDYVLRGLLMRESPKKLNVKWTGPMRITRCLSDFLFETQDLITGKIKLVHGSRLRFFRNRHFEITEDVNEFLRYQQGEYASVQSFLDLRENSGNQEVLVAYLGFEGDGPEWVSLQTMYEDVPERLMEALEEFKQHGLKRQQNLARKFLSYISNLSSSQ